jgi:hypothetical protein
MNFPYKATPRDEDVEYEVISPRSLHADGTLKVSFPFLSPDSRFHTCPPRRRLEDDGCDIESPPPVTHLPHPSIPLSHLVLELHTCMSPHTSMVFIILCARNSEVVARLGT